MLSPNCKHMSITWPTPSGSPKSSVSVSILYSRFLISSTIPGLVMVTVVKEIANNVRENNPNILFNVTDSLYCWQCWASILEESDWVEGSNCWVHSDIVCLKLKPIWWTACLSRCTHKARIFSCRDLCSQSRKRGCRRYIPNLEKLVKKWVEIFDPPEMFFFWH